MTQAVSLETTATIKTVEQVADLFPPRTNQRFVLRNLFLEKSKRLPWDNTDNENIRRVKCFNGLRSYNLYLSPLNVTVSIIALFRYAKRFHGCISIWGQPVLIETLKQWTWWFHRILPFNEWAFWQWIDENPAWSGSVASFPSVIQCFSLAP